MHSCGSSLGGGWPQDASFMLIWGPSELLLWRLYRPLADGVSIEGKVVKNQKQGVTMERIWACRKNKGKWPVSHWLAAHQVPITTAHNYGHTAEHLFTHIIKVHRGSVFRNRGLEARGKKSQNPWKHVRFGDSIRLWLLMWIHVMW